MNTPCTRWCEPNQPAHPAWRCRKRIAQGYAYSFRSTTGRSLTLEAEQSRGAAFLASWLLWRERIAGRSRARDVRCQWQAVEYRPASPRAILHTSKLNLASGSALNLLDHCWQGSQAGPTVVSQPLAGRARNQPQRSVEAATGIAWSACAQQGMRTAGVVVSV